LEFFLGSAIAQAVNLRFHTASARIRARVRSCGVCGGLSGTGAVFLLILQFPLAIRIPPIATKSPSSGAGTIGQIMFAVPSGLSLTPWE
jgi:hypothetical protein